MKRKFFGIRTVLFVLGLVCVLSGCATLQGFSGEDKGAEKIAQGVEQDLGSVWNAILKLDAKMREKLW